MVSLIVILELNPDIWLSPLMVLGTQWYILFNVIAGASTMPQELRDAADNFGVHGWLWWKKVALPAVFPYYVTGAITASGGAWNASIVAEVASWGNTHPARPWPGRLYRRRGDGGRFPPCGAGHRGDELLCGGGEPHSVAAALLVRRTQIPANVRLDDGRTC